MKLKFSDFQHQNKSEWADAAIKTLKGKPLDGLQWKVDEEITLDPIYTSEEAIDPQKVLINSKPDNDWWIGEEFSGEEPATANDLLLKALSGGLNSPCLLDVQDYEACLNDVHVDFLFPIFKDSDTQGYLDWLKGKSFDTPSLEGGFVVCQSAEDAKMVDIQNTLRVVSQALPKYYHSTVWIELNGDPIAEEMTAGLSELSALIFQLKQLNLPVRIICEFECSNDFIKCVSSIRALRLILAQICEVYDIPQENILLDAHIFQSAPDTQLSMIGASTQATAAVTAGVDRLTIQCEGMQMQEEEEVRRRMTRNIHHMMKMESGLHHVKDPAAGSYTIEKLTSEIAQSTWKKFQNDHK